MTCLICLVQDCLEFAPFERILSSGVYVHSICCCFQCRWTFNFKYTSENRRKPFRQYCVTLRLSTGNHLSASVKSPLFLIEYETDSILYRWAWKAHIFSFRIQLLTYGLCYRDVITLKCPHNYNCLLPQYVCSLNFVDEYNRPMCHYSRWNGYKKPQGKLLTYLLPMFQYKSLFLFCTGTYKYIAQILKQKFQLTLIGHFTNIFYFHDI